LGEVVASASRPANEALRRLGKVQGVYLGTRDVVRDDKDLLASTEAEMIVYD
jgi:hypothetical protein